MITHATIRLPADVTATAPDGADVRELLALKGRGSMAHFSLAPGRVSGAVVHRTVEEIWFILSGRGEMWRSAEGREDIAALEAGVCLTIPLGTRFQFRSTGEVPVAAIAVTMPPWPGADEAVGVAGPWEPRTG